MLAMPRDVLLLMDERDGRWQSIPWERSKKKAPSFDSLAMALPRDTVSMARVNLGTGRCQEGKSWLQDDACSVIWVHVPVAIAAKRLMMLMTKSKMARKRMFHWSEEGNMVAASMVDTSQGKDDIMFLRFVGIGVFEICDDAGFMMRSAHALQRVGACLNKNERHLRVLTPRTACLREHHAVTLAHSAHHPK